MAKFTCRLIQDNNGKFRNIKSQIAAREAELKQLQDCKMYIWNNFEAKQSEVDGVLDIIAQVIDRKEAEIRSLKDKIITML